MPILALALGFLVSLFAALLLVPTVCRVARRVGWLDEPDGTRKIHRDAVPNVGGLAIVGAAVVGIGVMTVARIELPRSISGALTLPDPLVVLGALGIAAVGFWDDRRAMSHRAKFVAQLVVTALAFAGGARVMVFDAALGAGPLALAVSGLLTVVWMVGMMNAVNLVDGMDGLAAGVVAIAFVGLAGAHALGGDLGALVLAAAVCGALLGFLRYNFAPATVFMGDSGSLFLGYALAAYALRGTAHPNPVLALVIPAVIMGIPVLDTAVSILRRKLTGQRLFYPDRDHIHHRLQAQMSTRRAALTLYAFGAYLALGALAMATMRPLAALVTFLFGSAAVYGFLGYVRYLPTPGRIVRYAERRQQVKSLVGRKLADTPRAGRVAHERFEPTAGPER
ncbi:glycosyltransferase family 4 protein [Rubrivirga sp. IMCC45206]|uniref:glycosyltransferase family 4 protein n=1 Tax=Rubrivirga sp. IMCC45206 TaxID=3391614 RepID=UPI0039903177